jgi:PST family polysaccharide transporter
MDLSLAVLARTRRRLRSLSDAILLARVVIVMGSLPIVARLSTITMLRWLERVGRVVTLGGAHEPREVVAMVRSCGGLRRWSFQDNCVSQSLTLFTLLNRDTAPLDVVFGIEQVASTTAGAQLGRRHVWLERDGEPVYERQPLLPSYIVQMRYRGAADAAAQGLTTSGVIGALGVSGIASALTTAASLVRTKAIAMLLGPVGMAASGQVAQATAGLGWLATFGGSAGTTRYLAEAVAQGDERAASTVVRSSGVLIAGVATMAAAAALLSVRSLAVALFGSADAAAMIRWLLPSIPAIAVTSLSASLLRSTQQVGRLSAAQSAGAVVAIVAAFVVLRSDEPKSISQLASLIFVVQACAVTAAAWPLWRRWSVADSNGISLTLVRGIAAYGASNVVMGLATAALFLFIGRSYLAAGEMTRAGHIAALAWFGEPVASMLAAGLYASTFPAYCAAHGPEADRVLSRSIRALVLAVGLLLTLGALLAPLVMRVLFDPRFSAVAPLLTIQLIATYGRCVSILLGLPLLARGRVVLVTALHLAWAAAAGVGATWHLAGPSAYAVSLATVTWAQVVLLAGVLAAARLSPPRRDYAWIAAGAAPLLLLLLF